MLKTIASAANLGIICVTVVLTNSCTVSDCFGQVQSKDWSAVVNAHRSYVESLHDISVKVTSTFTFENEVVQKYSYHWMKSPHDELIRKSQQQTSFVGEYTNLSHSHGNRSFYNGSGGFIGLKDFDGVLVNNEISVDSPASGRIGPERSAIGLNDPWGEMGLYPLVFPPPSRPLWVLVEKADTVSLVDVQDDSQNKVVELLIGNSTYRVWLNADRNNLVEKLEIRAPDKVVSMHVMDFRHIPDVGYFPAQLTFTQSFNGPPLTIETNIEVESLNIAIPAEEFLVAFPKKLPFYNETTGAYGIWGDGGPDFYFSSESEGREYSRKRIQAALGASRRPTRGIMTIICVGTVVFCVVIFARRWFKAQAP